VPNTALIIENKFGPFSPLFHMGEARTRFPSCWTWARCQDNGVSDPEREKRWAELFDQLDLNKDGRIDVNELRTGLTARGILRGEVVDEVGPGR